jgi:hypothetical protein
MRNSIFRGILLACVMIPFLFKITDAAQQFVAFWSFDSVSADTYYDVTGHGYDAKGTGSGFSIISGVKDDALNCSGSGFDIAIANSKDSFVINKFAIELWFFSNIILSSEIVDQQKIFDFTNASSGVRNGYSIGVMKSGKFHFSLASSDGSRWVECPSTAVLASKKWYHLAASYDSTYGPRYTIQHQTGILLASRHGRLIVPHTDTIGNFVNPFISLPVEDTTYEPSVDLPFARIFWRVSANTNSNLYSEIDTFWIEDQTALGSGSTVKKTGVSMLRSLRHGVMLAYSLDKPGKVSLTLYSIAGSFITRIEKESASSAASIVLWNGTDRYGRSVPNGSYCVVCIINGRTFSKIISLMR